MGRLATPRISTQYPLGRTNTFRSASHAILESKWFEGWGTNLQNWEKGLRRILLADPGYEIMHSDQAGAEAKIVAYLCRAGKYRDLFKYGIKPHSFLGLHIFKKDWVKEQVKLAIEEMCTLEPKDLAVHPDWLAIDTIIKATDNLKGKDRRYYLAKQTEHSSNYDIKEPTFILNVLEKSGGKVVLDYKSATYFLNLKKMLFPEIPEWHYEVMQEVDKTSILRNLFGHPRLFTGDKDAHNFYKECFAFIPQSTIGEITHKGFVYLQNYIESNKKDWHLLLNGHDSIDIQKPLDEPRTECYEALKVALEVELISPKDGVKFRMGSECSVGLNLAPYHKEKNPNGLQTYKGI